MRSTKEISALCEQEYGDLTEWSSIPLKKDTCLIWKGPVIRGSPSHMIDGQLQIIVRRNCWERNNGVPPKGSVITQGCGNKLCVRVEHLVLMSSEEWKEERTKRRNDTKSSESRAKQIEVAKGFIDYLVREFKAVITMPEGWNEEDGS